MGIEDDIANGDTDAVAWWIYLFAISLALLSAFFSGLTLGLMTQDITTLEVLVDTGKQLQEEYEELKDKWAKISPVIATSLEHRDTSSPSSLSDIEHLGGAILHAAEEDLISNTSIVQNDCDRLRELRIRCTHARYATRILKLRRDGNLLLVTLLVGNVGVNSAFSIIMGEALSSLAGFLVSTVVITIFGEILPQAACSRNGLIIGYYAVPLLIPIMWILWPICKPIAWCLDQVLGKDIGQRMGRDELCGYMNVLNKGLDVQREKLGSVDRSLSDKHSLNKDEASWIAAVLNTTRRSAGEFMTPLAKTETLNTNEKLTSAVVERILGSGFSRFPVVEDEKVKGIFFLKDFMAVPHNENLTAGMVMAYFNKRTMVFPVNVKLYVLFKYMSQQQCHMVILADTVGHKQHSVANDDEDEDPEAISPKALDHSLTGRHVGIITLEDVIEKLLKIDILDEYDLLLRHPSSSGDPPTPSGTGQYTEHPENPSPINMRGTTPRSNPGVTPALASLRLFSEQKSTIASPSRIGSPDRSPDRAVEMLAAPGSADASYGGLHDVLTFDIQIQNAACEQSEYILHDESEPKSLVRDPRLAGYDVLRVCSTGSSLQLSLETAAWNFAFLLDEEIDAAVSFLRSRELPEFRPDVVDDSSLRHLLRRSLIVGSDSSPRYVTTKGQRDPPFLIVLTGRLLVFTGDDNERTEIGPWETLCVCILAPSVRRSCHLLKNSTYWEDDQANAIFRRCTRVADFDAMLEPTPAIASIQTTRVLVMPGDLYTQYARVDHLKEMMKNVKNNEKNNIRKQDTR